MHAEYKIASFNMYNFNRAKNNEQRKDLKLIAAIIKQYDLVAMQEVLTENVLKDLLRESNLVGWTYCWEAPRYITDDIYRDRFPQEIEAGERVKGYSKSKNEAEGYAFFWNTEKFALSWSYPKNDRSTKKISYPMIYNQYRLDKASGQKPLARNPYYGRFRPIYAGKPLDIELRLINTHIVHGGATGIAAQERKREFEILASQFYRRIHDNRISEVEPHIVAYTIMLGDYNLNLNRNNTKSPYLTKPESSISIEEYQIPDNLIGEGKRAAGTTKAVHRIVTTQDQLTTLKRPNRENFDPEHGFANNFDHFSYDIQYKDVICKEVKENNTVEYMKKARSINDNTDAFEEHKKVISDHIPIEMTLSFCNGRVKKCLKK